MCFWHLIPHYLSARHFYAMRFSRDFVELSLMDEAIVLNLLLGLFLSFLAAKDPRWLVDLDFLK